jgi:hypothetical protein
MKSPSTILRWLWIFPLFALLAACGGGGGGGGGKNNPNTGTTCVWGSSNWGGCSWGS